MKRALLLTALIGLVGTACNRSELGVKASPSTARATFELEGSVVEASGSASVSTTTAATPTTTASPTPTTTPTPIAKTTTTVVNAAPGSIALKLTAFSTSGGPCDFKDDDVVVLAFTRNTSFKPEDITKDKTFPNNLQGGRLRVSGTVAGPRGDDCLLVADVVEVTVAAPSPSKSAAKTPSPTPTSRRATPSPSR
jgi:hypothetical protein